jgi:hypothetical protein
MSILIHDRYSVGVDNINHAGRVWLMASYLYYLRPDLESFITDNEFDALTQVLMNNYEILTIPGKCTVGENPPLSNLITMESLQAGSGFDLQSKDYPTINKHCAVEMTRDKFWTLKQEFTFKFPYVKRLNKHFDLEPHQVSVLIDRGRIIEYIKFKEPILQNHDRYYQGDPMEYDCDEKRIVDGILLKDNEASEFYNGMLYHISTNLKDGLVLGNIFYDENKGWIARVYDPVRSFTIEA